MGKIKENIVYPARFQPESGGGIRITFPDFPKLLVIARDWQEGMELAQRQLALAVIDRLDSGRELPAVAGPRVAAEGPCATEAGPPAAAAGAGTLTADAQKMTSEDGPPEAVPPAELVYLHIWLPYFRSDMREVYVKKSVTIPQWLDVLAKKSGLNFSAALVRGIKEELGIRERKDI
ncbi:hypothetical protein [Enterocloster asparagiformis]|uniref:type II toxin-antitoxin system HicB family antitoxin n=1 Tax=Enterocloster asparagiformis TaxID=333367 RepID=UPI002A7F2440|nr:hypothetical protein [Enterocloster asparagiformis]